MNKKFYLGALALPLVMAACSSEETLSEVQGVQDRFEGIAKVDATFNLDGAQSRLANNLGLEAKDKVGMAWLGVPVTKDEEVYGNVFLGSEYGYAYQNHPLIATSPTTLKPETSIYVGKYFIYHPYDALTQRIKNISFDIEKQPLTEDVNATGKKSIYLSSELTDVTLGGDSNNNNKAGEDCRFTIKARQLTNLVALEAAWKNNDLLADEIEAPIIESIHMGYSDGQEINSVIGFDYAPTNFEEGYQPELDGPHYWGHFRLYPNEAEPYSRTVSAEVERDIELGVEGISGTGFTNISEGMITLAAAGDGYVVEGERENAKFYYNALPGTAESDTVVMQIRTDYGVIDYKLAMNEAVKTKDYKEAGAEYLEDYDGTLKEVEFFSRVSNETVEFTSVPAEGSILNRLYKTGKIEAEIDFFDAKINGMHVKNDDHLQKLLKFFMLKIAKGNTTETTGVTLFLDAINGDFEISKESVAMLQEINAEKNNVLLKKCNTPADHTGTPRIVLFNNGTDLEVPSLYKVFGQKVEVYLKDQTWTWGGTASRAAAVKQMGNVATLHNLGTLNVNGDMNYASKNEKEFTIENKKQINVNVKMEANININNHATIDVKDQAEFWAGNGYTLVNLAKSLEEFGTINNEGVLTVTEKSELKGQILNYGLINHKSSDANANVKTYITANQTEEASFTSPFEMDKNMFGTIMLNNKFDNVSVSNETQEGFIKYAWNAEEDAEDSENIYKTPTSTYYKVKYNYLIVDQNIKFIEDEAELKFLEVAAGKDVVIAAERTAEWRGLGLTGIILGKDAEANIQLKNRVKVKGAFITNGIVRVGGEFEYTTLATYLGGTAADYKNIGKY